MAFRRLRRTKDAIRFTLQVTLDEPEVQALFSRHVQMKRNFSVLSVTFRHSFSFRAKGESIRSEFAIVDEQLSVTTTRDYQDLLGQSTAVDLNSTRNKEGSLKIMSKPRLPVAIEEPAQLI